MTVLLEYINQYKCIIKLNELVKSGKALAALAPPSEPPLVNTIAHSGITKVGHTRACVPSTLSCVPIDVLATVSLIVYCTMQVAL